MPNGTRGGRPDLAAAVPRTRATSVPTWAAGKKAAMRARYPDVESAASLAELI